MCAPFWSNSRSLLMGELGWMVELAYTSTLPSRPRYTWRGKRRQFRKCGLMSVTIARGFILYLQTGIFRQKHSWHCSTKMKGLTKRKTRQGEYLHQLTAPEQIKSHLCRIAAEVAMNVITTQSNLIWSTGRHLWPKWFPGLQTLMLPHANEISRGSRASFHEPSLDHCEQNGESVSH